MKASASFRKMPVLHSCSLLLFILTTVISGCTTVHKDFTPLFPVQKSAPKTEARAAIVLTDELCSLYYKQRTFQEFSLGPIVCENAANAARAAFSEPAFYTSQNDARRSQADLIGILRPEKVWLDGIKKIPATVIANTYLSWEMYSPEGERLYGATVYGKGADQRTFGGAGVRYQSSMQKCLDDLTRNLFTQMVSAKERGAKNAIAAKRIREAVEAFQVGTTTYAQYLGKKDGEWHIFALEERAKQGKKSYSYLIDPISDKNESSIGSWVTEWSRRQPVVESLRPSVYLPESRIDHAGISDIYLKELVGPAYDNRPLCELVFEGNDMDSLILTRRTFLNDFPASGSFHSVDALFDSLNENVRRWVKLRPGMSTSEVIALIGRPPKMTLDTSINRRLYNYGFGLVEFYQNGGLSQWKLN